MQCHYTNITSARKRQLMSHGRHCRLFFNNKINNNNNQQKKKKTCKIVSYASAYHRIKLKECQKKDKYLDLARELKNYGT